MVIGVGVDFIYSTKQLRILENVRLYETKQQKDQQEISMVTRFLRIKVVLVLPPSQLSTPILRMLVDPTPSTVTMGATGAPTNT